MCLGMDRVSMRQKSTRHNSEDELGKYMSDQQMALFAHKRQTRAFGFSCFALKSTHVKEVWHYLIKETWTLRERNRNIQFLHSLQVWGMLHYIIYISPNLCPHNNTLWQFFFIFYNLCQHINTYRHAWLHFCTNDYIFYTKQLWTFRHQMFISAHSLK